MTTSAKQLITVVLSSTVAGLYTAAELTTTRFTQVTATNLTSTARKISAVHMVPSGGSADASNQVVEDMVIPANKGVRVPLLEGKVLEEGGILFAGAETDSAITLVADGWEMTT